MRKIYLLMASGALASKGALSWQEQLISRMSMNSFESSLSLHSGQLEDDSCEDRCILNPSNRLSCGRSRSQDQCDSLNCCWDADSEMCYKQVFEHCPRDECERIDPFDRQICSEILGPELNQEECAELGCCYDSYVDFCYSSAPKETAIAPATLECRKVASHEKQSCGYGLSRSACLENTGCCWHVDDQADTYCYKSAIVGAANNFTSVGGSSQIDMIVDNMGLMPPINLKVAGARDRAPKVSSVISQSVQPLTGSLHKKLQQWTSYGAAFTQKIELSCAAKSKQLECINNKNSQKLLGLVKKEIEKENYGLARVDDEFKAKEMLRGLYDVLSWFCLSSPSARFCRTLVLSGFTLTEVKTEAYSAEELILEANTRYEAFLRLMCDFKMLGAFRPQSSLENQNEKNFESECAATFLLMQVHAPSLGAVEIVPVQNSHACALEKGCWKQMSLRAAIIDLFGEYTQSSKKKFINMWRSAMSPLLTPPEDSILVESSCIMPTLQKFIDTREAMSSQFERALMPQKKAGDQ